MTKIGKRVTETINDGISTQMVDDLFHQKEGLVTWACEDNCDAILFDIIVDIMEPFEIDNLMNLNPFL
jgi:hypothetical protein